MKGSVVDGQASYYETLRVLPSASKEEITKAYKKRALRTHPDRGGDDQDFKRVAEAYEVLKNPLTRQDHDQKLGIHQRMKTTSAASPSSSHFGSVPFGCRRVDPFALFDEIFASADLSELGIRLPHRPFNVSPAQSPSSSSPWATRSRASANDYFGPIVPSMSLIDALLGGSPAWQSVPLRNNRCIENTVQTGTHRARPKLQSGVSESHRFCTSFDSNNKSGWGYYSESRSTCTVNGHRVEIYRRTDVDGTETVHTKSSDGFEKVEVDGVPQPRHPLLLRRGSSSRSNAENEQIERHSSRKNKHHHKSKSKNKSISDGSGPAKATASASVAVE